MGPEEALLGSTGDFPDDITDGMMIVKRPGLLEGKVEDVLTLEEVVGRHQWLVLDEETASRESEKVADSLEEGFTITDAAQLAARAGADGKMAVVVVHTSFSSMMEILSRYTSG